MHEALMPNDAARKGNSLNVLTKSKWVIRGVPANLNEGRLHDVFAKQPPCIAWEICPHYTLGQPRGRYATWLVGAEVDPPVHDLMLLGGSLVSIE